MKYLLTLGLCFIASGFIAGQYLINYQVHYIGCFDTSYSMSRDYYRVGYKLNLDECFQECVYYGGFRYIGSNIRDDHCSCGNDIPEWSVMRNDADCILPCEHDDNPLCGALDGVSVYENLTNPDLPEKISFLVGMESSVRVYNISRLPDFNTVMTTDEYEATFTVDYHLARNLVFAKSGGRLLKVSVTPEFAPESNEPTYPTVLKSQSLCDGFAVDWVSDRIFYGSCNNSDRHTPTVFSMDLYGNKSEQVRVLNGTARGIKSMEIDPYERMLFLLSANCIESLNMTVTPAAHTDLTNDNMKVSAMTLDRVTRKIFFVARVEDTTPLFMMDYNGRRLARIYHLVEMKHVLGLGVLDNFVYWINIAMDVEVLYRAPLRGSWLNMTSILTITKTLRYMKLIHADDQTKPDEGRLCRIKGCSQFCEKENSTYAECQCSPRYALAIDGVTCVKKEDPSVKTTIAVPGMESSHGKKITTESPVFVSKDSKVIKYQNATYVGCFGTQYPMRGQYSFRMRTSSLDDCIDGCFEKRKPLVGISAHDRFCFCGTGLGPNAVKYPHGHCTDPCPLIESTAITCGGEWLMSVYNISVLVPDWNSDPGFFLIRFKKSIVLYNTSEPTREMNRVNAEPVKDVYHMDFHFKKNYLFISRKNGLFRHQLLPSNVTSSPVRIVLEEPCHGIAIDWVSDQIYCISSRKSGFVLKVSNSTGEDTATLWTKVEGELDPTSLRIDPYQRLLFWTNEKKVASCKTSGDDIKHISLARTPVTAMALDIPEQRIYYVGKVMGARAGICSLFGSDYDGNNVKTLIKNINYGGPGMGVARGTLYWLHRLTTDADSWDRAYTLFISASLNVKKARTLKTFSFLYDILDIRLVYPDVQQPPASIVTEDEEPEIYHYLMGILLLSLFILITAVIILCLFREKVVEVVRICIRRLRDGPNFSTTYNARNESIRHERID